MLLRRKVNAGIGANEFGKAKLDTAPNPASE